MTPPDGGPATDRSSDSDDASDGAGTPSGESTGEAVGPATDADGREVEVPPSLYRVVTVFSTLLSILLVVVGFSLLGAASTVVNNPPASLVVQVLSLAVPMETLVGYDAAIALVVGLVGLAVIAGGAAVYVYGSRFRAPGMGKPKDASDEDSHDG